MYAYTRTDVHWASRGKSDSIGLTKAGSGPMLSDSPQDSEDLNLSQNGGRSDSMGGRVYGLMLSDLPVDI